MSEYSAVSCPFRLRCQCVRGAVIAGAVDFFFFVHSPCYSLLCSLTLAAVLRAFLLYRAVARSLEARRPSDRRLVAAAIDLLDATRT